MAINRYFTFILLVLTIFVSHYVPTFVEMFYSDSLFPIISGSIQAITSVFEIPLFFLYLFVLVILLVKYFKPKGQKLLIKVVTVAFWIIAFFYISWGFNYSREKIATKLLLNTSVLAKINYQNLLHSSTQTLNVMADTLKDKEISTNQIHEYLNISSQLVKKTMLEMGYIIPKSVTIKQFWPEGLLLRFSTAGFYFPFTAECYVDKALHSLQLPFIAAHECVHGFGIGDEGTCNFIAYVACKNSGIGIFEYSAEIEYWKSVKRMKVNAKTKTSDLLHEKAFQDLKSISTQMNKYPDIFPETRDLIFNTFLKLQGIHEGEENYNKFIDLIYLYKK